MSESSKLTVELPSDTEVVLRRTFDAPRHLVFDAITKPEHVVHWWGLHGSTVSHCTLDLRPGGRWRMVVREASGEENGFGGEIREVSPPERFVWTFGWDGAPGEEVPEEWTFLEHDGKTTVITRSFYPDKESRDRMIQSGMEAGAAESYDRLEAYLGTRA